jgi:hypothetical protein
VPFKDHPAITIALLSAALIAARLLSISRFDVSTAATILEVSGVATAVAGTALTLLPFAIALATAVLAVMVFVDDRLIAIAPFLVRLLFALAVGATLFLTALPLALVTLIVVVVIALIGRFARRSDPEVRIAAVVASSRLLRIQATVLVVAVALAPIILQRPWLPVQAVTFKDGDVTVGYVLGDSAGQLVLMSDIDRTIQFIDPLTIEKRSICSGPAAGGGITRRAPRIELRGSLLGALLWGDQTPHYPSCPRISQNGEE